MDNLERARRLTEVIELRKALEREEKELKEHFKGLGHGGPEALNFGEFVISLTPKARPYLDQAAIRAYLGPDVVRGFERTTTYVEVDARRVSQVEVHPKALEGLFPVNTKKGS